MNYNMALVQLPLVRETANQKIATPEDAYRVCRDLADLAQEAFHVLSLNTRNGLINRHLVSLGLADTCLVHPREVFRPVLSDGASAVVVAHNHPSGDVTPSAEDLRITRRLIEAGKIIEIKVLDHVVIGRGFPATDCQPGRPAFLSLRESGLVAFE